MTKSNHRKPADESDTPGTFENLGRKIDERPEVQAARDALLAAREQFERARSQFEELRSRAADDVADLRERSPSDVLAGALEWVRKHPGPGVAAAIACGWFAGRIFRR